MKKVFKVYFEIYGKKMQTSIEANSKIEAVELVKSKLKIHKVEEDDFVNQMGKIFNDFMSSFQ